jgi:hypothetical protein
MVIYDVPDPEMSGAIAGVAVAAGAIQNPHKRQLSEVLIFAAPPFSRP